MGLTPSSEAPPEPPPQATSDMTSAPAIRHRIVVPRASRHVGFRFRRREGSCLAKRLPEKLDQRKGRISRASRARGALRSGEQPPVRICSSENAPTIVDDNICWRAGILQESVCAVVLWGCQAQRAPLGKLLNLLVLNKLLDPPCRR